jgi:uncharacterized iron-regulated membrane protein
MKNGFRQSMSWVHTWGGLVVGWVLFFIFVTGTLGYFDTEIDRWMKPELMPDKTPMAQALSVAETRLQQQAPEAKRWFINPPTNRDNPQLRIFWEMSGEDGKRGVTGNELLDSSTGEPVTARATGGGQALYRMHYALHYLPTTLAYWIVGICSMFMLVAIITGVIIHKKIFKDFFTFRPQKGQRSWLDMHNLLSVVALPFYLMITYSGLIFFVFTYMPLVIASSYGTTDAQEKFFDELFAETEKVERANSPASLASLSAMATIAEKHWGSEQIRYIEITNPGDANARVSIGRNLHSPLRASPELIFKGSTGELLNSKSALTSTPRAVRDVLLGLHEGLFADISLRWLYFFSGLIGTAMIAAGLILWVIKRRPQQLLKSQGPDFGHRLVESLNLGMIVGLPIAIASYFWANRLLDVNFSARSAWEMHILFITLLAAMLYPFARSLLVKQSFINTIRCSWVELLWVAALAYGFLPLLNAITTERSLFQSIATGDWLFATIDLIFLITAVASACTAKKLQQKLQRKQTAPEQIGNIKNISSPEAVQ